MTTEAQDPAAIRAILGVLNDGAVYSLAGLRFELKHMRESDIIAWMRRLENDGRVQRVGRDIWKLSYRVRAWSLENARMVEK